MLHVQFVRLHTHTHTRAQWGKNTKIDVKNVWIWWRRAKIIAKLICCSQIQNACHTIHSIISQFLDVPSRRCGHETLPESQSHMRLHIVSRKLAVNSYAPNSILPKVIKIFPTHTQFNCAGSFQFDFRWLKRFQFPRRKK